MLENIMMKELNCTPLQLAGVSTDGINFIRAMLVVEPSERVTIGDLLTFPWINKVLEESNLSQISEIKPSQESFMAHRGGTLDQIGEDSEEDDMLEVDDLARHFGTASKSPTGTQEEPSLLSSAPGRVEKNMLFGEIDPGAIRSSGVLADDARAALQMENESGWNWSFDADNLSSFHQSQRSQQSQQNQHRSQQSLSSLKLEREHSSPSLFGAEAQIGRLNMVSGDSVMSDKSYPTAPTTPKTPGSPDHSFAASFSLTGSKRSPAFSASDEVTPKRAKVEEGVADRRPSNPAIDNLRGAQTENNPRSPTVNSKFINAYEKLDVTGSRSGSASSQRSLKAYAATKRKSAVLSDDPKGVEATSVDSPLLPPDIRYPELQNRGRGHILSTPPQGPPWSSMFTHPTLRRQSGNLMEHQSLASSSTQSSARSNDEHEDPVTYPSLQLPNSAPQLTTFSPTGGSNDSNDSNFTAHGDRAKELSAARNPSRQTSAQPSLHFGNLASPSYPVVGPSILGRLRTTSDSCIQLTIIMTGRITMWGREHTNTHIWPDTSDRRIPRAAFDIVFWCKAFGDAIEVPSEVFWREADNLRASIRTRSSAGITINEERLERCDEIKDYYGFLCSGDVVTVNGKVGETIRFVCEFERGESMAPRVEGRRFEVKTRKAKSDAVVTDTGAEVEVRSKV